MNVFLDIATYAFRGSGKYILAMGAILSVISDFVGFVPILGLLAVVVLAGYFCAIYFEIIMSTAGGGGEAPNFPEASNLVGDILWPMVQVIIVVLFSFAPSLGYAIFSGEESFSPVIFYGLLAFAIIYFPMAMLAVVVLGHMGAMGPHIVLPGIFRAGWLYWVGVVLLCLLYVVESFVVGLFGDQFIVGTLVVAVMGMYTMMTNGRILGVLYREREEELNWV